ncbi:MAG: thiamine diphosphokinase [Acidimicrobiia bacterium]|nr:thiamine diphosphokinase [Acidimicrobiia bacterium]
MNPVVIVVGGAPPPAGALGDLPVPALVIAADSGLDHAISLGMTIDLVIGDLDSVSPASLEMAGNARIERHPADKDATDLELALDAAIGTGTDRIVVLGGHGGRLDHLLGNVAVISSPRYHQADIEWIAGPARIHVVHDHAELHGTPGEAVTLLPVGGPAGGVWSRGLKWELQGEELQWHESRGVSNEFVRPVATVGIDSGVLLTVQPLAGH